jgi:hypothetical protein
MKPTIESLEVTMVDLTDPVNANWRDVLRKNPSDPSYVSKDGIKGFDLGKGTEPLSEKKKKAK